MTQPALPGIHGGYAIGDELDRCYTKPKLAAAVVATCWRGVPPSLVGEPSVGGGAFARAIRQRWGSSSPAASLHLVGVDIDPDARGFEECDDSFIGDWPELAADWVRTLASGRHHPVLRQRPDLIVGNPPFGEAIPHVEACLSLRPQVTALILPWAYWGVAEWRPLLWGPVRPAVVRPIAGRPWPEQVRETAVYEWHGDGTGGEATRIEPLLGWP